MKRSEWSTVFLAGFVIAAVVAASIGLVRLRNRDRQATPAIVWAAESLEHIPDSVAGTILPLDHFTAARQRFCSQLRGGVLPVDSVRRFYQAYALWARDGRWSEDEILELAPFLGLAVELDGRQSHSR